MSFERSNVRIVLITVIIGALICAGIVVYGTHKKGRSVTYDRNEMLEHAHKFYEEGDIKKAVSQMEYYCLNRDDVFDEEIELAGWYKELGDEVNSIKTYKLAVGMADYSENEISVNEPFYHVGSDSVSFTIEPVVGFTQDMELIFKGEDITPEGYDTGKVNGIRDELTDDKDCRTTPWTEVDKSKGSVILTGDMNCAIWQFMNANGEITNIEDLYYEEEEEGEEEPAEEEGENVLCRMGSIELTNRSYSIMEIPEDAVKCRVTYADESIDGRTFSDSKGIIMFYGNMLQGYSDSGASSCKLPDLTPGQSIVYDNGKWELFVNGTYMQDLDIVQPAIYDGAGIFMQGEVCGKVIVEEKGERAIGSMDAEYGVEFSVARGLSVGRRLGDAVGMHFDYCADDEWVGGSGNDFDLAYPWSEMKLCNVINNGEKEIIYQGEAGYADDGSNGNVMVEIPKFYVKRLQLGDTEQIWISGSEHDGYVIDPVFMDNGEEKDHVYIGAYQGCVEDDILVSKSGVYPAVNMTYDEMRTMARANGDGYRALGYNMYAAIQKLFLVETGCLDSTSLMAGEQDLYFYSQIKDYNNKNTAIAIQSVQASNKIVVNDFYATEKLEEGSSVVFLNASDGWEALEDAGGPNGTDKPKTKKKTEEDEDENRIEGGACREITSVEIDGGHIEISFDGEPIDIRAGETVIASYPSKTGKTGNISYCTGYLESNNGRHGFKYRNIENIYGSQMTMLGADSYIKNGTFFFTDGEGEEQELDAFIPEQNMGLDGGISDHNNTNDICIKKMSYDSDYPTVMIPVEFGASVYSWYGDYYYYKSSDDEKEYYLCVGDPMNSKKAGGLFQMRAIIDSDEFARYYCGGRLMFR